MARKKKQKTSVLNLIQTFFIILGKPLFVLISLPAEIAVSFLEWMERIDNIFKKKKTGLKNKIYVLWKKYRKNIKKGKTKTVKFKKPKKGKAFSFNKYVFFKLNKNRLFIFLSSIALFFSSIFIFWHYILKDLPKPIDLVTRNVEASTKIYDRNGVLLYKIYKNKNRTLIPLNKIPLQTKLATLAAEDAEFYDHPGISLRGIVRSIFRNTTKGELAGGSTITQQLVKNALLTPEKTVVRKIKEAILALQVENTFSKDEILEMYLNEVAYGGTYYGIEEAAQAYFDKSTEDLDLPESAYLAGIPKKPTQYSPFSSNPEEGLNRQKEVLNLMKVNGFISSEQLTQALEKQLTFSPKKIDIKAPHFVMYVKNKLEEKYGGQTVEQGGLEVITTLDYRIQSLAEETLRTELDKIKGLNVKNGAVVVTNPKTGEILAMVGSKNYFDDKNDGNVNVTTSLRQPGSSIKIVNYAYALSNGYTPASIIDDSPISFRVPGNPIYSPKNYDNKYRGRISLRSALAESRNIPAVKVLASYGVEKMIDLGTKMGVSTWNDKSRYGLSLTLGGGETKLIDLAKVYGTVADYGKTKDLQTISLITDYKGNVLEKNMCLDPNTNTDADCKTVQTLDPRVAYLLIDILKDNSARSPSFGYNSQLIIPKHPEVAVKTGTSNDLKDNLTIGFNQDYLVAVWVGNNDNLSMNRIASGVTGAAPIFNKVMSGIIVNTPSQNWEIPDGLVKLPVCLYTGSLTCEGCPTKIEYFLKENQPKSYCTALQIQKIIEEKNKKQSTPFSQDQILDGISTQN